jgi:hypothetical protein
MLSARAGVFLCRAICPAQMPSPQHALARASAYAPPAANAFSPAFYLAHHLQIDRTSPVASPTRHALYLIGTDPPRRDPVGHGQQRSQRAEIATPRSLYGEGKGDQADDHAPSQQRSHVQRKEGAVGAKGDQRRDDSSRAGPHRPGEHAVLEPRQRAVYPARGTHRQPGSPPAGQAADHAGQSLLDRAQRAGPTAKGAPGQQGGSQQQRQQGQVQRPGLAQEGAAGDILPERNYAAKGTGAVKALGPTPGTHAEPDGEADESDLHQQARPGQGSVASHRLPLPQPRRRLRLPSSICVPLSGAVKPFPGLERSHIPSPFWST